MILAVANQKGGVGKTTIAFSLAKMSSLERETLAIDLDPQGNFTSCFTDSLSDSSNVKLLWEKDKDGNAQDGLLTPSPLGKNFSLIGSDISLSFWETGGGAASYFKLGGWLKRHKQEDTWTIIDCPPNLGIFSINAFIAADYVLIPVDASKFCITGLEALFRSMKEVNRELRQDGGLKVAGILLSAVNPRMLFVQEIRRQLREKYKPHLMETNIPASIRVREALADGEMVSQGPAYVAFQAMYHELKGRIT